MRPLPLARTPLSPVTVDACDNCQALWLDATESQQLTPGALIELFRAIGASQRDARTAYPALLPCPRCTTPLSSPVLNQRWRCCAVPWVKPSGTT